MAKITHDEEAALKSASFKTYMKDAYGGALKWGAAAAIVCGGVTLGYQLLVCGATLATAALPVIGVAILAGFVAFTAANFMAENAHRERDNDITTRRWFGTPDPR